MCVDEGGVGDMCVTVRELLCLRLPSKQGSRILFLSEVSVTFGIITWVPLPPGLLSHRSVSRVLGSGSFRDKE